MNDTIKWDLSDFYTGIKDPQIQNDLDEIKKKAKQFNETVKGVLTDPSLTVKKLKKFFIQFEKIKERTFYLNVYSYLLYSTTSQDDKVKALYSKIQEFSSNIEEKLLFFPLELNKIKEEKFQKIINDKEMKDYKHFLEFNRKKKKHQLSEAEEQIILMKDLTGSEGYMKLYSELTSSYTFHIEIEGEKKELTGAELSSLLQHKDRDIRKKALDKFVDAYRDDELIFTHVYNNMIKDYDLEMKRRKYEKPIQQRNLQNEVTDEEVEALEQATTESYSIVEKYYTLKKKILELEDLHMYDIYAPIGKIDKKYTYTEAIEIIKKATSKFDPELAEIIDKLVTHGHVDATPRKGKEGGAYCHYGKLEQLPFVFVNFAGTVDSLLTLAHELGHAIHFYYILQEQNFINLFTSIPMAEIASVFCEIIVFDYLVNQELTKEERLALLANHIESNFATSHRQNAFFRFEQKIHELMEQHLPTTRDLTKTFVEEMQLMFGDSITNIEKDYSHYCFVISHFLHTPFYVYAYNMSNLMVIALYQLYLEKGKEYFIPRYKKMLAAGGSLTPDELLSEMEVNTKNPAFWQKGIEYLAHTIKEIENML